MILKKAVKEIAKRIRAEIIKLEFDENIVITISIGVAELKDYQTNNLVKMPDDKLYE